MIKWTTTTQHWLMLSPNVEEENSPSTKFSDGYWCWYHYYTDSEGLSKKLQSLLADANELQKEVKAIIPLTNSSAHERMLIHSQYKVQPGHGQYGGGSYAYGLGYGAGAGFGASFTAGLLVIIQANEYVTEEEYSKRVQEVKDRKAAERRAKELAQRAAQMDAEITPHREKLATLKATELEANRAIRDHEDQIVTLEQKIEATKEIATRKKALGGTVYVVDGKKHKTMELAEAYQQQIKDDLAAAQHAHTIALEVREEIRVEIAEVEAEISEMEAEIKGLELVEA